MAYNFDEALGQHLSWHTDFDAGVIPVSISAWCKPTDVSAGKSRTIISGGVGGIQLRIHDDEAVALLKTNVAGIGASAGGAVTNDVWQQIGARYDGTNSTTDNAFFVAGSRVNWTTASEQTFTAGVDYHIGRQPVQVVEYFHGLMGEVAVWAAFLTDDEFKALGRGYSPLFIRPGALLDYVELKHSPRSHKFPPLTEVNGVAVSSPYDHPLQIYPRTGRRLVTEGEIVVGATPAALMVNQLRLGFANRMLGY